MRRDMAKVIVERPRWGSSIPSRKKGYRKLLQKTGTDNLPRREPMAGRWRGMQRHLNEHLGPMRRFLRSNVGRPWNAVHRDLCEHVSFDNAVQKHVLAHVFDYVVRFVDLRDGVPVYRDGWRIGCELAADRMYVCPATGLLRLTKAKRRQEPFGRIMVTPRLARMWRDGHWWEVRLVARPEEPDDTLDVWIEQPLDRLPVESSVAVWGDKLFAVSKRPLNREETRRLQRELQVARKSQKRKRRREPLHCPSR